MTDPCRCPPEAGNSVCDLPAQHVQRHVCGLIRDSDALGTEIASSR